MLSGAAILVASLFIGVLVPKFVWLLPLWLPIGLGYSLAQTPSGRLLRRSSHAEDTPALFAAQFALPHVCWLITYPLAGWLGATAGLPATVATLDLVAAAAMLAATRLWPAHDPEEIEHIYDNLAEDHAHIAGAARIDNGHKHARVFVIDSHHPEWPAER